MRQLLFAPHCSPVLGIHGFQQVGSIRDERIGCVANIQPRSAIRAEALNVAGVYTDVRVYVVHVCHTLDSDDSLLCSKMYCTASTIASISQKHTFNTVRGTFLTT